MTLILAIIPVLLLIVLMAFFKMSGDKSSIISLIVTMLIALFGFAFSVDNLFYSFLYGALKAVSPILIIILMAIFSYNVLLKTEKMEIIKQQFASISTDKSIQVLLLTWGFGGLLEAMAGFGTAGCYSGGDSYQSGIQADIFGDCQSDSQQCRYGFRCYRNSGIGVGKGNESGCATTQYERCIAIIGTHVSDSAGLAFPHQS